jgi:hypothetical protein
MERDSATKAAPSHVTQRKGRTKAAALQAKASVSGSTQLEGFTKAPASLVKATALHVTQG